MKCALCREEIQGEPFKYKGKDYCCQACAFEASVRIGSMCGSSATVEAGMRYQRGLTEAREEIRMAQTIAIDGPVAVGKSSVGKSLAARLGYNFVDTGAMYRALTWKALQLGIDPNDERKVPELAGRMQLEIAPDSASTSGYRVLLDGRDVTSDIRAPAVEAAVSFVSRIPEVRRKLVARQREMAGRGKVVMVGRDIGTIVLPGADLKVFLTASPEQRAVRRYKELEQSGKVVDCESVLRELKARDTIDSTREDSPLKPAPDARTIDTSDLSLEQVVDRVYELARNAKCSSKRLPTE